MLFQVYFELGFDHILDIKGYDHILFIIALCATYTLKQWKKLLIIVTAFTVGHSLTLALSASSIISASSYWIELLIPVTILLTAIQNFIYRPSPDRKWVPLYILALFFGFIHGMGFSNYFRSLLGREADIVLPLFGFNVGVEAGQLCIVALILFMGYLATNLLKVKQNHWNMAVSLLAVALSVQMIIQRI